MGISITGNYARIWVKEHQKSDGTKWHSYNIGIGKKRQNGTYVNAYMKVKFGKSVDMPSVLPNGTKIENFEGFMSVDDYIKGEQVVKEPMLVITKAEFPDLVPDIIDVPDSFSQLDEQIPF